MPADAARDMHPTTAFRMTVEEFLKLPPDRNGRILELVHGEVRAQDAASDAHGTIQARLNALLVIHVDDKMPGCRIVANPGIKPNILAKWNHRVPELGVTCAPNRADVHAMPAPIVLVEILSPSNRNDTWDNVPLYTTVPTVMEILLVESTKIEAHMLRRCADGTWPEEPTVIGSEGTIELTSISLSFPLAAAYRGTHLATLSLTS